MKIIGEVALADMLLPAMAVQARSRPKTPFNAFIALAKVLGGQLTVYVDNLFSQLFLDRSDGEQGRIDAEYSVFFKEQNCEVLFTKDIWNGADCSFPALLNFSANIPVRELINCLPIEKRNVLNSLDLTEIIHFLLELLLFAEIRRKHKILLIGQTSQAIVAAHRNITKNSLSAIVLPKFRNPEHIDDYVKRISNQEDVTK